MNTVDLAKKMLGGDIKVEEVEHVVYGGELYRGDPFFDTVSFEEPVEEQSLTKEKKLGGKKREVSKFMADYVDSDDDESVKQAEKQVVKQAEKQAEKQVVKQAEKQAEKQVKQAKRGRKKREVSKFMADYVDSDDEPTQEEKDIKEICDECEVMKGGTFKEQLSIKAKEIQDKAKSVKPNKAESSSFKSELAERALEFTQNKKKFGGKSSRANNIEICSKSVAAAISSFTSNLNL